MTTVIRSVQVFVHAPVQKAFDYVADLTQHPQWSGGELKIEPLSAGPVAVGKQYSSKGQVATQKDRPNQLKVVEYDPPRVFGFVAHDPDFGDVSHIFTFLEQNGGTLITRTMTLNLQPFIAIAFRFVVYPLIGGPANQKAFDKLKANLEA